MDILHRIVGAAAKTLSRGKAVNSQSTRSSHPKGKDHASSSSTDDFTEEPECTSSTDTASVSYWQWEAAVQSFTDFQIRRWISLSRSIKGKGLHVSSSAPALSSPDYCSLDDQHLERQKRLSFSLIPSSGIFEALRGLVRWNPIQGIKALLWPVVTLGIFVAPAGALVLAASSFPSLVRPAVCTWAIAEVVFLVFRAHELKRANKEILPPTVPSPDQVSQLLDQILALRCMGVVEPHEFLGGWFLGASPASLSRQRVKEFLAHGLYHSDLHELPGDVQAAVEEHLNRIEARWGIQFACQARNQALLAASAAAYSDAQAAQREHRSSGDLSRQSLKGQQTGGSLLTTAEEDEEQKLWGGNHSLAEKVSFMAHTREPLRAILHPLALYAWGHMVGGMTALALTLMGFNRRTCKSTGMHYYILRRDSSNRKGQKNDGELNKEHSIPLSGLHGESDQPPESSNGEACVFVHGLGIGVTPYLPFIQEIMEATKRKAEAIAVVELPHLAFRLTSSVPTVDELVRGLDEVVEDCVGTSGQASFIGHSYGSLVLAQYARTRPERVAALGLIDPVCILLCLPNVIYNFVYKYPDFETLKGAVADSLRMLMCSRELNVARALCRGFNWHDLHLWAHQMPRNTVVMLAEEDRIVPADRVRRYLEAHSIPVIFNQGFGHAQFLFRPDVQKSFLQLLYGKQECLLPRN